MCLDELLPLNMIGMKKVTGGALEESELVEGVAFKKAFSYAGFEMQVKTVGPAFPQHPPIDSLLRIRASQ